MNKKIKIIIGALLVLVLAGIVAVAVMIVKLLDTPSNNVTKEPITLCVGQSAMMSGSGLDWSVSVPGVISVDSAGKITGVACGTTQITAISGNNKYQVQIIVADHNIMEETCTTPRICTRCNTVLSPELGHSFSVASCTTDSVCARCNKVVEQAYGHNMTTVSCTESAHCITCGYVEQEAYGHDYCEVSCTQDSVCSRCGDVRQKALGHDIQGGSCTESGVCSRCNKTISEATGHKWEKATCKKPETCSKCGATRGEKLTCQYENLGTYYDPETDLMYADLRCIYCDAKFLPAQPYAKPDKEGFEIYTGADAVTAYAKDLLSIINEKRTALKIPVLTLTTSTKTSDASLQRAKEIMINYSGTRLDDTEWTTAYEEKYTVITEAIARGYATPQALVDAWMKDDAMRANMLNANYSQIALTCVYAPNGYYKYYWEVVFIVP